MHKQKVELNIPLLTLAKITQLGRHGTVNSRNEHYVLGSQVQSLLEEEFLMNYVALIQFWQNDLF